MKKKILFSVCLLFGLMFINSGLNKFFNYIPVPDNMPEHMVRLMGAFLEIGWLFPLVAVVEIIGGFLFIIPKTRALGAIVVFPVMIGVLLVHFIDSPSGLPIVLVLFAIHVWVIIENWHKYLPMLK
jgi:uncharacterized membrane protein YphA (DoxX/SURF4 family)